MFSLSRSHVFVAIAALPIAAVFGLLARAPTRMAGALPAADVILVSAKTALPNYSGTTSNDVCCLNDLPNGSACGCASSPDGTVCYQCSGASVASAIYVAGFSSGVQPSGANGDCTTYEAYAGTCQDWFCVNLLDTGFECEGTYPQFILQFIVMNGTPLSPAL